MRIYLSAFTLLFLISCSAPTAPYFKEMSDIKVQNLSLKNVTLESKLIYHNPNLVGANVKRSSIDITVNDVAVGRVEQNENIEVSANSDFELPVIISFPPKDIFQSKGLLRSALQVLANEKADVVYKGTMTISVAGVEFDIPVNYEDEVTLKNN